MISEPELELSMSNTTGKNHIQRSQIDIYISQYKQYYMVYKEKYWEMLSQIHQGVMSSWHILKKFLKEEEIVRYSNGCNPLSSKPQIKQIKEYHGKKKEASNEEALVAFTSNNQLPQEGKKNKKKNWRKPYPPSYRIPEIQKDAMENVFKMARTLMKLKDKEELRIRQPHFPKK
ncbi:hypothetical protein O181_059804 [Austropuccinia psidii MF-1]|uniref:Uncharacterized protein n=1 Tax=Austropuccinia psidii MF-1 TaxID=1389203 RepID=A0A9Q3HYZ9_9BASI|nr:hypothetical protein [Austropuccinia psidii MF-1]